nr:hypothetical protein CFP56_66163 [Quercus suber]
MKEVGRLMTAHSTHGSYDDLLCMFRAALGLRFCQVRKGSLDSQPSPPQLLAAQPRLLNDTGDRRPAEVIIPQNSF